MKQIKFLILSLLLFSCIRIDTAKDYVRKQSYKGILINYFQDESNHMTYSFEIKTQNQTIVDNNMNVWPRIWEYAEVGDSIIKPPDTLMIMVKKNDTTYKEFFYKF